MGDAATPVLPDAGTQAGTTYKANIDAGFAVVDRLAWAFAPHEQGTPDMTVRLEAGAIFDGTTLTEKAAQSTGTITAPSVNPRIDRVVIDRGTGVVSVITGAEDVSPSAPAITAGDVPVAQVALTTSTSEITNSDITDERNSSRLGFGDLQADLDVPSQAEAEAGTSTTERVWTAERVKQAIAALETSVTAASQAEQETGTDITKMVTPGRQHFHASAAKAWLDWSYSAGVPQDDASYNIGALDDDGSGDIGVHFTTAMSSANYVAIANAVVGQQDDNTHTNVRLTTEVQILVRNNAGPGDIQGSMAIFGDL